MAERNLQIRTWANAGLALLYPEVCQLCDKNQAGPERGYVCEDCQAKAVFIEPPFCSRCGFPYDGAITGPFECENCRDLDLQFDWARSAARARGPVLEAIHRFKYGRQMWFETFLAGLFLRAAVPALKADDWDAIMPVPLHPLKQREREFNQAERMALHLSRATGIPLMTSFLKRTRLTDTQAQLTRKERLQNVRAAFAVRETPALRGSRCLLVDDVFTTGCTTSACAAALREAGTRNVAVWTVARGG